MATTGRAGALTAVLALGILFGLVPGGRTEGGSLSRGEWVNHGGGIDNWRYARDERRISPDSVKHLRLEWEFVAGDDISATPAIYRGVLYFPSWNGNIYAVRQHDGSLLWSKNLTRLTGLAPAYPSLRIGVNWVISRATPVVYKHVLLVGLIGPGTVIAVNRFTGDLIWSTQLDEHPVAIITQSGTAYKGYLYVGVSSVEEGGSPQPCCSFIGSFQKLDVRTGEVVWRTRVLPDNGGNPGGYAGAAIWGSSPSIDPKRNLAFVATGNVYSAPPRIDACEARQQKLATPQVPDPCVEAGNHGNSILALELETGNIRWGRVFGGYDAWTAACVITVPGYPNCPAGPANDYDFGEAPMLLTIPHPAAGSSRRLDIVVAGQKSGIVWAVDRDTGHVVWDAVAGPGSFVGGAIWGSATDGKHVYTNIVNFGGLNYTLVPSSEVTNGGAWVAIEAATGRIEWTTAAPNETYSFAPVSLANGVLFVAAGSNAGDVYALGAKSGNILWHSSLPKGLTYGGFSISGGCAFVGAGYSTSPGGQLVGGTPGTSLYAFCLSHS